MVGLKNKGLFKGYRSAFATIFLEPIPSSPLIGSILRICCSQSTIEFENVVQIRGDQLVSNDKEHTPFAFLENKNQPDEAYRYIYCKFIIKNEITFDNKCENCQKLYKTMQQIYKRSLAGMNSVKIAHASKEILIQRVTKVSERFLALY
ncbi:hypothetical protein RhiirA4_482990 [Rhizophagus irregularis]|uniref:Uncharacterized protein n=1 Tax=Rhizophagus irregularis TaxID=588596 RepID=A0A2I1HLY1_9GLOM|nr:hypothetical protein RhiirA4_482990 [Rhizophagus irregularis]